MIGSRLKELRAKKQITQEELGKIAGVTTSMIGMYEIDARKPSFEVIEKIADYFNVTVDYILGRESSAENEKLKPLTPKEEKDIAKDLEKMLSNLESEDSLAFMGEPMDDETKELMKISLENSMRLAKQLAKKKFTPKKYK
ncbi:helix-turn-helix domain-containing protein [Desulfosporosinus youngiae]|uniref:Putative transcriptional regulator n=1 Tax=Desulfosporosinus youngiae DSM 17734 TaxID=768710 RepID=H5Y0D2_9FIRM|nr:helix-turn-helix transcriptional regulator [Desulfosporosinus youngiae]EHQ92188.1 putative transcriptional regulator [Desulfosporosinus youngiae DSM 17734]